MQYVAHTVKCKHPSRLVGCSFLFAGLVSGKTNRITDEFPGKLFTIQLAAENTVSILVCAWKINIYNRCCRAESPDNDQNDFYCLLSSLQFCKLHENHKMFFQQNCKVLRVACSKVLFIRVQQALL